MTVTTALSLGGHEEEPLRLQSVPLRFAPTPRLRRLTLVAALAIAAGVISGRGELAVLAAVPLVVLALHPRRALAPHARVALRLTPTRCLEDDELDLELVVAVRGAEAIEATPAEGGGLEFRPPPVPPGPDGTVPADRLAWTLVARRWGRYDPPPVRVDVRSAFGLYVASLDVRLPRLTVYPGGGHVAGPVAPRELPARLGEHASRALGSGVEFGGVRVFTPGDRRRDVDWRTSAKHGQLFVRQYADERAFDLALLLDVGADAGEPGRSTLDLTMRAATGLASSYLRSHDRVGVVTLGGWTRWLTPDASVRQLHKIAELVMSVRADDPSLATGLTRVPRAVLKPGTFVVVLSPMLDRRALDAIEDLHGRGLGMLVVDVLLTEPDVGERGGLTELSLRLWRLEREAVRVELARLGVPLIAWDGTGDLTTPLLHAMRSVPPGVRA